MADIFTVASKEQIPPGQGRTFEVAGHHLALFNVGGTIYATDSACLHRGGPLGEGDLEGEIVTCPWHAWQFNVRTGENPRSPDMCVGTYKVHMDGDTVKVEL